MDKKIILITGASSGIGRQTAMELAKQGHQLIIHGQDPEKTKGVFEEIIKETGNKDIEMFAADFSLMAEVKSFSEKIKEKYDHLDVLINNAGAQFGGTREETSEGHEKTIAINTLAPFLLTNLLMDLLKKSTSARIVTVSSESYRQGGTPNWDDIEMVHDYSLTRSYGLSKRFVWWLMREFSERLKKNGIKNVTVNTCEPGSAVTGLQRVSGQGTMMKIVMFLWKPFVWSVEKAAATSIYLATSEDVEGISGKFYGDCKEKDIKSKWISDEGQKKIWDYCAKACKPYL